MIEIPDFIKNSHCRWESWHVPDKLGKFTIFYRFARKVYYDKELRKEITEEDYETQRAGGRLRHLGST